MGNDHWCFLLNEVSQNQGKNKRFKGYIAIREKYTDNFKWEKVPFVVRFKSRFHHLYFKDKITK